MFCPNCGNNIPDDSVFCENCGTNLKKSDSVQNQSQEAPLTGYGSATWQTGNTNESVSDDQKPDKQEQTKRIVIIAAVAVLVIILVRALVPYVNMIGIAFICLIIGIATRFFIDKRKK